MTFLGVVLVINSSRTILKTKEEINNDNRNIKLDSSEKETLQVFFLFKALWFFLFKALWNGISYQFGSWNQGCFVDFRFKIHLDTATVIDKLCLLQYICQTFELATLK